MEEPILKVSLKEYKKSIDELRASLLGLDSASEEYKSTAEEIKNKQEKLNEVMSVGKKDVDAAAGSYNALSQEMSKLKKEWKNMEMGTDAWKEMAVRINEMNDRLKDADASVGVFSRNVGDYANAFGAAFDKAAGEIAKVNGPLGSVFQTVKNLIPVIKSANSTAVKGLTGVKAALVSTGIGALIVAVGLLVSHWGDLMKLVSGNKDRVKNLEDANNKLNDSFDDQNFALEQEIELMEADGASIDDIIAKKQDLVKQQIKEKSAQLENIRTTYEAIKAHSWLGRVLRGEQGDYKELEKMIETVTGELEALERKDTEYTTKTEANARKRKREREDAARKAFEAEKREVDKILERIDENSKTELQKLTEKYQQELALLKKHHKSTKALEEQYAKDVVAINKKLEQEKIDALNAAYQNLGNYNVSFGLVNELRNAETELDKFAKLTNQEFPPEGLLAMIEAGEDVTDVLTNMVGDEVKLLETAKEQGLIATENANEFAAAWISAGARVKKAKVDIVSYNAEMYASLEQDYGEYWQNRVQTGKDAITAELEFEEAKVTAQYRVFEAAAKNTSETEAAYYRAKMSELEKLSDEIGRRIDERAAELKIMSAENDATRANTNKDTSGFWNTSSFDDAYQKRIEAARVYLEEIEKLEYDSYEERAAATLAAEQNLYDITREYNQKKAQNYMEMANQIGNIFGSIADIYQEDIEQQKKRLIEQGKTEEEANKMLEDKFEASKAFQIVQATISTITGAIQAFMSCQELGFPQGQIIGGITAAAVTAAGIAQIQKIKNTTIGSTGSIDSSSMNVTPKLQDYNPERTTNITSASDTDNLANALSKQPVYVKVSDIDRAQKKVEVRDSESRF